MDVNQIQKQIAELIEKLKEIGIDSYYDNKYTFKIRNDEYDSVVTLNNSNEMIYISISNESSNSGNTITFDDINSLISLKEKCDDVIFKMLVNYLFFNKNNQDILKIIGHLTEKNSEVLHEMIENNEINETENEITDSVVNRNKEISNYIIDYLNKELSNDGARTFLKNKRYYISEDNEIAVLVMRSKRYNRTSYKYWYTFHKYQKDVLDKYKNSYVMLYFDDKDECILIETEKLYATLSKLGKTQNGESIGWHLHIQDIDGIYSIRIPFEGLLNIKNANTLELEPFKNSRIRAEKESQVLEPSNSATDGQLLNDDKTTLKITYDDFKVIKFKH